MKGFKKRAPLALWKVIVLIFAGFVVLGGGTALVMYLLGMFDEKVVEAKDMSFSESVEQCIGEGGMYGGEGYGERVGTTPWFYLSSDSRITIVSTTKDVTETKVLLTLRNGQTQNGKLTDGIITIPEEVELNKPFKVELVRNRDGSIVGSSARYSLITAKLPDNIYVTDKQAYVAVDNSVAGFSLSVDGSVAGATENLQNVVIGSRFNINPVFSPESSKTYFNSKTQNKRVFYRVVGGSENYVTQNSDGTFSADIVSGAEYSTVYAYAFKNSYYEYAYFRDNPDASYDDIIRFMQAEENESKVVGATTRIKVLDIKVKRVEIEPNEAQAGVYVDKMFNLSTSVAGGRNDMTLGASIFDSNEQLANVLLSRIGIKVPKGRENFDILGGNVMKVTTTGTQVSIVEESFKSDFDYSRVEDGVEYYILPRVVPGGDYGNYYWSFAADKATASAFNLEINFFSKDDNGLWERFFASGSEKTIEVVVKEASSTVSLNSESFDIVINYDDKGLPKPGELPLTSTVGGGVYSKVVYFLYDDTRDNPLEMTNYFNCKNGVVYSTDYNGQPLNITGISELKDSYTLYELPSTNMLTVKKNFAGSVYVVAALVRTDAYGNLCEDPEDKTKYQIVCLSGAKIVNVESTLSIANMTPTFTFKENVEKPDDVHYYLPAINTNKEMIEFNLKLSCEDVVGDVKKLGDAYEDGSLKLVVCDKDGVEYPEEYLTLSSFAEVVENRTANLAEFVGIISINESKFSAGRTVVDQGRSISFKLVYDDGIEEPRSKMVGMDDVAAEGEIDYFYVYYQQPTRLEAKYQTENRPEFSASNPITVDISSGDNGLKIDWGGATLTAINYNETINALNDLLTFTMYDQFDQVIDPNNNVYRISMNEIRADSNNVLIFDIQNSINTKISDFASTNGKEEPTGLKVFVVDGSGRKAMSVADDGSLTDVELQSELLSFVVSTEGLDHVKYDTSKEVGNKDDARFADAAKNETKINVEKTVKANDTITLSDLFRVYTTTTPTVANMDYKITFSGSWLQGFNNKNGVALKKMLQINGESSDAAKNSVAEYEGVAINSLKINAPFGGQGATLTFEINSTNNLYRITLNLLLKSEIDINRSFESYHTTYIQYLTAAPGEEATKPVSVFADEEYDLDQYLTFKSDDFSWADAFVGKGLDLGSNVNGVFYASKGVASLDVIQGENKVKLALASVRTYTEIEITLYYGVKSEYAFSYTFKLYVNPNIVIEEKVSSLEEYPLLDLKEIEGENIITYYNVYKATSYINGSLEPATIDANTLKITDLNYTNKDANGFISVQSGSTNAGKFMFIPGRQIDILNSYVQEFAISVGDGAILDAVKVRVDGENNKLVFKYDEKNHVSIGFSVCYNQAGINELVQEVFPEASVISYDGEPRLLFLAGTTYGILDGFHVSSATGNSILRASTGTEIRPKGIPTFIDHDNSVDVYSTVSDGVSTLQINISLGVTVSNIGKEFVYYTNDAKAFNSYRDTFVLTKDTVAQDGKLYYAYDAETGSYTLLSLNAGDVIAGEKYEVRKNVDFNKLISSSPADLEEADVFETLSAGKSYKILHDISKEYTKTTDTEIDTNKTYFIKVDEEYVVVESPDVGQISTYFEKNAPEQGFYYNSALIKKNGGSTRDFSVRVVESGVNGYVENLAFLNDGILTINSMEKNVEGYIVLEFTISTSSGSNTQSFSWYYRIKVLPNFEVGKVNYPYNELSESISGEYLDTSSSAYDSASMTYSIDMMERFNAANSKRNSGYRFDDIKWFEGGMPEGVITENYRLKSVSSNDILVAFDGATINISYKDSSCVGNEYTVVVEKYWGVGDCKIVGSAMEYIFKLNMSRQFSSSLYRDDVKDSNKVGPDNSKVYDATIVAGSGEQVFIPTVRALDSGVTGQMEKFGYYVKGDMLELLDALQFKKIWLPAGSKIDVAVGTPLASTITLAEDTTIVETSAWLSVDVETRIETTGEGDAAKTETKTYITYSGSEFDELEYISEGDVIYLLGNINLESLTGVNASVKCKIKLEDVVVDFLTEGTQEYRKTADESRKENTTYYVLEGGAFVEATFEDGADFAEGVTYYDKYRTPYRTVVLKPKSNISKDSSFEFGVYTSEGVVYRTNLKAESYYEWKIDKTSVDSGKTYFFNDFISSISSKNAERPISEITMTLTNGEDQYREYYYQTDDAERKVGEEYYVLKFGEYNKVEFEGEEGFDGQRIYYEKVSLKLKDVVDLRGSIVANVEGKLDLKTIALEIAPLIENMKLNLDITIKSGEGETASYFTFSIVVDVVASFDESATRQVQDFSWRYGQIPFNVKIKNNETAAIVTPSEADRTSVTPPTVVNLVSTGNTSYQFAKGEDYTLVVGEGENTEESETVRILPTDVEEEKQGIIKTLTVVGRFKSKQISRFKVNFRYSVAKNVMVTPNYPTPDGETASTTEYISATTANGEESQRVSKDFTDFFNSSATFAEKTASGYKHRIEAVTAKLNAQNEYEKAETSISMSWEISISSISNLQVKYSTGSLTSADAKIITNETTDKVMLKDSSDGKINLNFTLLSTSAVGLVTFDVRINKVLCQYNVTVVKEPIIKIVTNTPDYNLNQETVYAEDLAKSEDQKLFSENRLLGFAFKNTVVAGDTYYAKLTNKLNVADSKMIPITVPEKKRGTEIFVDLGKSHSDYEYTATYNDPEGANSNKITDDQYFLVAPHLTSRIKAYYYNDTEILFNDDNYIKLGTETSWTTTRVDNGGTATVEDATNKLSVYNPSSSFLISEAGHLVTFRTTSGDVVYTKVNPGDAYVGYFNGASGVSSATPTTKYSGLILLSKDKEAIKVSKVGGTITGDQSSEFKIDGQTWYVLSCAAANFTYGSFDDVSGLNKVKKLSGATWIDCVEDLIRQTFHTYRKAESVDLKTEDYQILRKFFITLQAGDEELSKDWYYNMYLDTEFAVSDNTDSAGEVKAKEIMAGKELSLLDGNNEEDSTVYFDFGIYNKRTGNKYSNSGRDKTDNLRDSGGKVNLYIYGLPTASSSSDVMSGIPIVSSATDELQMAAYQLHKNFMSSTGKDTSKDIVYNTGLNPRAGQSLTTSGVVTGGSYATNYLTYSRVVVDGKNVDFSIRAQGSDNDGNHVMLKITYTVELKNSTTPIQVSHNLLFKVVPNSTVSFLSRQGSAATTGSSNYISYGSSYATNIEAPYAMMNNDDASSSSLPTANRIDIWKTEDNAVSVKDSAVQVFLYGNKTRNNANYFTYTMYNSTYNREYNNYRYNKGTSYYYAGLNGSTNYSSKAAANSASVYVNIPDLKLGERKFYIEGANDFNFKIRFYFTLTATENPTILRLETGTASSGGASSEETLKEGQAVVVGSQFMPISPAVITAEVDGGIERRQLLGSFEYMKKGENSADAAIANTIGNIPTALISKIYLYAETAAFGTVIKGIDINGDTNDVSIWTDAYTDKGKEFGGWHDWRINGTADPKIDLVDPDNENGTITEYLKQDGPYGLLGSTISVYGVFKNDVFDTFRNLKYKEAGTKVGSSYNDKEIKQTYSEAAGYEFPTLKVGTDANSDKALLILRGISAYGFRSEGEESIHALNMDLAPNYKSRVKDIKVSGISYYRGEEKLGDAIRGKSTPSGNLPLITSGSYKFYDGTNTKKYLKAKDYGTFDSNTTYYTKGSNGAYTEVTNKKSEDFSTYYIERTFAYIDGVAYENDKYDFLVPVIDSIYFEDKSELEHVRMEITLTEGTNTCVLSKFVTISRLATEPTFASQIMDNTQVKAPEGVTVLNDTLEIVLDPGESVSFVVSDSQFTEVPQQGIITKTNNNDYAVTEYVGISSSIQNLDYNFNSKKMTTTGTKGNSFYITVIDQKTDDEIEFNYNGNKISKVTSGTKTVYRYDETSIGSIVSDKKYYTKSGSTYTEVAGSAFFKKTTDTTLTNWKTYYTLSDTHVYTPVLSPNKDELETYYEAYDRNSNNMFYRTATTDDLTSGVTLYKFENNVYTPVEEATSASNLYVEKQYYERAYQLTTDTSIDASKKYFTRTVAGAYIEVSEPTLNNLGTYYEEVVSELYNSGTIDTYTDQITLHINSIKELKGDSVGKTLYFLFKGNDRDISGKTGFNNTGLYYQMKKTFSVYPQFEKITSESVDVNGNIELDIDRYLEAYSSTDKRYYIIPRSIWGGYLEAKNYAELENISTAYLNNFAGQYEQTAPYKFVFESSTGILGGAGGAFVDEYGNIITGNLFNIQGETATIKVYMRVSGQNGFFDEDPTKLGDAYKNDALLCTFRFGLSPDGYTTESPILTKNTGDRYGTLNVNGSSAGVVAVSDEYELHKAKAVSGTATGSLNAVPYYVYGYNGTWEDKQPVKTIACEAGKTTLDFAEILGTKNYSGTQMHNVTYHIVQDTVGTGSSAKTKIIHNKLNTYDIVEEGTHTLTVLVSYRTRNSDSTLSYGIVKLSVMAYNSLNTTDKVVMLYASGMQKTADTDIVEGKEYYTLEGDRYIKVENPVKADLNKYYQSNNNSSYTLGSGNWYDLANDGTITEVTTKSGDNSIYVAPCKTGIYNKKFVSKDANGDTKVYSYTFYVVSPADAITKTVVLNQNAPFNLSNLFEEKGYRFWKVNGNFDHGTDHTSAGDGIVELSTENFAIGANGNTKGQYIVRDGYGDYFKLEVTYKFTTSDSPKNPTIYVQQGGSLEDAVKAQVAKDIKGATNISVELIGDNGILGSETDRAGTELRIDGKTYLITYKENNVEKYVRYAVTFYTYKASANIEVTATPTNNFRLNLIGADVVSALNAGKEEAARIPENANVVFQKMNESGRLAPVTEISLTTLDSENITDTFIVQIQYSKMVDGNLTSYEEFYLINATFKKSAS